MPRGQLVFLALAGAFLAAPEAARGAARGGPVILSTLRDEPGHRALPKARP